MVEFDNSKTSVKRCMNPHIIAKVMTHDYWRAVWINGICYFRTFEDNVIYHQGLHIEQEFKTNNSPFKQFDGKFER